jgi:hypothetical protein
MNKGGNIMAKIIELLTKTEKNKSKEKEWTALGKKYKADKLTIGEAGDKLDVCNSVDINYGYMLTWHTDEDDIHVGGDGVARYPNTHIKVDEATYLPESIKKLNLAMKCLAEIEANRKKYYHKPDKVKTE